MNNAEWCIATEKPTRTHVTTPNFHAVPPPCCEHTTDPDTPSPTRRTPAPTQKTEPFDSIDNWELDPSFTGQTSSGATAAATAAALASTTAPASTAAPAGGHTVGAAAVSGHDGSRGEKGGEAKDPSRLWPTSPQE